MKKLCDSGFAIYFFILFAGGPANGVAGGVTPWEEPSALKGTLFELNSGTNKVLFTFKRSTKKEKDTVSVLRNFSYPNGSIAAVESVVYQNGELVSYQMDERQTGAHGSVTVTPDPKNPAKKKLEFEWSTTNGTKTKTKNSSETVQGDFLVADMTPYYITDHWIELMRGETVNFRLIVPDRLETIGFRFVKDSETTWHGKAVIRLRMEASNYFISKLVDPIFFLIEKEPSHRVLEYEGRTTPKIRDGEKWKDLDARSIYDW